jgi:hypothetical protein
VSCCISLKDQFLWVSNQRFSTLLDFALQIGSEKALSDFERSWVTKLTEFQANAWPGIDFDLGKEFAEIDEKKFWAVVFHDVARRIFLRHLGNHEVTFWQCSTISNAHVIARLLTGAIFEVESGWRPNTEDAQEGESFYSDPTNLRI